MDNWMLRSHIDALRLMHELVKHFNLEDAYEHWILVVPDEPSDEDFEEIAGDEEEFQNCVDLFLRICKLYGKEGIW